MIKVWAVSSGQCLRTLRGHGFEVLSVAFSYKSTQLASGSLDGTIKIWDLNNGDWPEAFKGHSESISSLVSSQDCVWLASASIDHTVKLWDISSGKCLQTLKGHNGPVRSVAFSQDSTQLASGSTDKTVKLWDMNSFECLHTIESYSGFATSLAFSYDSSQLISLLSNKRVKIWDAINGECLQTLMCPYDSADSRADSIAYSVALSYDSTRLAWGLYDGLVILCDMKSNKDPRIFKGHSDMVLSIAFSYDSTRLASSSFDKTVRIWDTNNGECLQTLEVGRWFVQLSFDLTGSYLHTDFGTIAISFLSNSNMLPSTSEPQFQGLALSLDGAWITYNSRKLVWLPSEYRPLVSTVSGNTIGVGVGSGDVWMYKVNKPEGF